MSFSLAVGAILAAGIGGPPPDPFGVVAMGSCWDQTLGAASMSIPTTPVDFATATTQAGDVSIIISAWANNNASASNETISGYTKLEPRRYTDGGRDVHSTIYYKVLAGAGDATGTMTNGTASSSSFGGIMIIVRGLDTANPFGSPNTYAITEGYSGSQVNPAGLTVPTGDRLLALACRSVANTTAGFVPAAPAQPADMTKWFSKGYGAGTSKLTMGVGVMSAGTGVVKDPVAWSGETAVGNEAWCAYSLLLNVL